LVYVDDFFITGNDITGIDALKLDLHAAFTIKDIELARYFLGLQIARSSQGTFLNQRKYLLDILQDVGTTGAKPTPFPLPKGLQLSSDTGIFFPIQPFTEGLLEGYCISLSLVQAFHIQCSV